MSSNKLSRALANFAGFAVGLTITAGSFFAFAEQPSTSPQKVNTSLKKEGVATSTGSATSADSPTHIGSASTTKSALRSGSASIPKSTTTTESAAATAAVTSAASDKNFTKEKFGSASTNLFSSNSTMKHVCPNAKLIRNDEYFECSDKGQTWYVGIKKAVISHKLQALPAGSESIAQ